MMEDFTALLKHLIRYRWWYSSAFLHVTIIAALYWLGPYEIRHAEAQEKQRTAEAFVNKAYRKELDKHLQDMRKIEHLIERLHQKQTTMASETDENIQGSAASDTDDSIAEPSQNKPEHQNLSEKPLTDMLREAKNIAEAIATKEILQRAEELAELSDAPMQQALEQLLKEKPYTEALSDLDIQELSENEIKEQVEKYHENSRQSLEKLVSDRNKEKFGSTLSLQSQGEGGEDKQKGSGNGNGSGNALADAQNYFSSAGRRSEEGTGGAGTSFSGYEPTQTNANQRPQTLPPSSHNRTVGRSIGKGGAIADRVYLDTWYMIGPFDYRGRHMRDMPHPPELEIDLEAVYPTTQGRYASWEFYQSSEYPIVPPKATGDATYYGYTEVSFDEATTVWLALGCDDDCKLWINDALEWTSGNGYKPWYQQGGYLSLRDELSRWSLVESYRQVTFKKRA